MLSTNTLCGRSYVVTGCNTGIGRAIALALAAEGADLVLACRSLERTTPVLDAITQMRAPGILRCVQLDLANLGSINRAADEIIRLLPRIDVLINNAAVAGARGSTSDGFELAFGVNHLGHYALTRALFGSLAKDARIVHLSSGSHARVKALDFSALMRPTASLTGIAEYAVSKLCVMLFHHELARRLAGGSITTYAADPGDVASDAWRHVPWPARVLLTRSMKTPREGARTPLFCATDASVGRVQGGFYVDCELSEPSLASRDPAVARELWERSQYWTGKAQWTHAGYGAGCAS